MKKHISIFAFCLLTRTTIFAPQTLLKHEQNIAIQNSNSSENNNLLTNQNYVQQQDFNERLAGYVIDILASYNELINRENRNS